MTEASHLSPEQVQFVSTQWFMEPQGPDVVCTTLSNDEQELMTASFMQVVHVGVGVAVSISKY